MQSLTWSGRQLACLLRSTTNLVRCSHCLSSLSNKRFQHVTRPYSTDVIAPPHIEGQDKTYPPKLQKIVDEISQLTLIEVADLNELLKKTLNIADTAMMPMGVAAQASAPAQEEEEEKVVKSLFTVNLVKFDEAKKVALIKEIKAQVSGMNLVQAKKFVEGVPQEVKADLSKEEAEKLKAALEAAGGTVAVE